MLLLQRPAGTISDGRVSPNMKVAPSRAGAPLFSEEIEPGVTGDADPGKPGGIPVFDLASGETESLLERGL